MRYFERIGEVDVAPLMAQLSAHPELWDVNPLRRTYANSPHREMTDVWVRARAPTDRNLASYSEPHESVWWPAADLLTEIKPIALGLMEKLHARHLGGILITKIPPGRKIHPHCDAGFWHAEAHEKYYVCLQGNEDCVTWCEDEQIAMRTGEVWKFENLVMHGLENNGDTDRISAIIALRREDA